MTCIQVSTHLSIQEEKFGQTKQPHQERLLKRILIKEKMIKAIIFDCDGVVVDSEDYSRKAYEKNLEKFKIKLDKEDYKFMTGSGTKEIYGYLNKKYKVNINVNEFDKEKEEIYRELAKGKLKVFAGVKSLIKELRKHNIKIGLASSGNKEKVSFNLEETNLLNSFDIIIKAEDISKSKPDPEIFLKTALKLGLKPEECVVIEDSIKGIEAGNRARMKTIAVTNTFKKEELRDADLIVNSLEEIDISTIKNL
jgi:HAD superfamily hydrolase (TIGR01509 family)